MVGVQTGIVRWWFRPVLCRWGNYMGRSNYVVVWLLCARYFGEYFWRSLVWTFCRCKPCSPTWVWDQGRTRHSSRVWSCIVWWGCSSGARHVSWFQNRSLWGRIGCCGSFGAKVPVCAGWGSIHVWKSYGWVGRLRYFWPEVCCTSPSKFWQVQGCYWQVGVGCRC